MIKIRLFGNKTYLKTQYKIGKMNPKKLKGLELVCKKCNNVRTILALENLSKEDQIEIQQLQSEMPELNLQFVFCEKCTETSIVSQYISNY